MWTKSTTFREAFKIKTSTVFTTLLPYFYFPPLDLVSLIFKCHVIFSTRVCRCQTLWTDTENRPLSGFFSLPINDVESLCLSGSRRCYLTGGKRPTGNVLCGLGLWECCGRFDLDRERQCGRAAAAARWPERVRVQSFLIILLMREVFVLIFLFCFYKAIGKKKEVPLLTHSTLVKCAEKETHDASSLKSNFTNLLHLTSF